MAIVMVCLTMALFLDYSFKNLFSSFYSNFDETKKVSSVGLPRSSNTDQAKKILVRLKNASSNIEDASLKNKILHVAVLESFSAPDGKANQHDLAIDVSKSGKAAVLLVADQRFLIKPVGATHEHAAKIAVESPMVFDISDGSAPILAGFRITSFGGKDVTSPKDYLPQAPLDQAQRFCKSMDIWLRHFDVKGTAVKIWRVNDARRLWVTESAIVTDSATSSRANDMTIKSFCEQVSLKLGPTKYTRRRSRESQ